MRISKRILMWLLVVVGVMFLVVAWPRLMAEYYYFTIARDKASVGDWVSVWDKLQLLGSAGRPVLLRLLQDEEKINRQFAADALRFARGDEVVLALMEVARADPEKEVKLKAIHSLGVIGDPRAVPVLRELAWRYGVAQSALSMMGVDGRKALLDDYQKDRRPLHRAQRLRYLCNERVNKNPEVRDELMRALSDKDWEVRGAAAECMPNILGKNAVPHLESLLEDPSHEVQVKAAKELGKLGNTSGIEPMERIILDSSIPEKLRGSAARAMSYTKDRTIAAFLRDVVRNEPSKDVVQGAYEGLKRLYPYGDPESETYWEIYKEKLWTTRKSTKKPE